MLRIAMLSYHTCPLATLGGKDTGGMNVYVRDLTRQLGRMGVHVDVFTRSQDEHVPHVLHDLGFGNRVVHIPAGPEVPLPRSELEGLIGEYSQKILEFARKKETQYDLIHSHYWMSGLSGKELKAEWEIPMVHMFHTLGMMKNRVGSSSEQEDHSRILGEHEVLHTADRIVAATLAEYAQLQWLYKADTSKIRVIPPGVDLSHFYPIPVDEAKEFIGIRDVEHFLLFVGRIEPLKGIDVLIRALAIMREAGFFADNGVCLAIIGGDPGDNNGRKTEEMARLQELSREAEVSDKIIFLGKQSQDDLPYYYSAADIVVVPSQYESFGMVALEAMACGTPVVASQVGGLAFLVQDGLTGYHVPGDDPLALAQKLMELIADPVLRKQVGERAAAYAKTYSWEIPSSQLISLYRDLTLK
ncbi:MAG TPA: glycosyltransferase [Anaerolineales bacterium]|nr:glycosyltransferase [Anaerolineales bacterium]